MKRIYAVITLLVVLGCNGFAQMLRGHIFDASTNEPLVGATVA